MSEVVEGLTYDPTIDGRGAMERIANAISQIRILHMPYDGFTIHISRDVRDALRRWVPPGMPLRQYEIEQAFGLPIVMSDEHPSNFIELRMVIRA